MSRIRLREADLQDPQPLAAEFRARRGGLLNEADRMVLHAPGFARGWNQMAEAVRSGLTLPPKMRTLVICAVGILVGADYQVSKHAPAFLHAGGTQVQLAALKNLDEVLDAEGVFDPTERAVLRLALEMTRAATVSERTFEAARQSVTGEQQIVELVGLIAFYNMVSRFLVALQVGEDRSDSPD
jgi:alkylhydroperoxidase family enzyme